MNCTRNKIYPVIALLFVFLAIIISALICCFNTPIKIENPLFLTVTSLLLIPEAKKYPSITTLQKVTAFYMISMLQNQLSLQYTQLTLFNSAFTIPLSMITLTLFALAFFFNKQITPDSTETKQLTFALITAVSVIMIHMSLLAVIIRSFYYYGCEQNIPVIANLAFYILLFIFSWPHLSGVKLKTALALTMLLLITLKYLKAG